MAVLSFAFHISLDLEESSKHVIRTSCDGRNVTLASTFRKRRDTSLAVIGQLKVN